MADFPLSIIEWYRQNKRSLPWRNTKNPYKIWLSEIIMQQTRIEQGTKYYLKFVKNYPKISDLANASEEQILNDWQGLGYYSRARNLHFTAKEIHFNRKDQFPETYLELLKLKGIGIYTAAAISSFSFDEPVAVVDGNVYRLLSRYYGIETPIDSTEGKKLFQELANSLIPEDNAAEFNQAIMEFGSLQCSPNSPKCNICPLNESCEGLRNNLVNQLPIKSKKIKITDRYLLYFTTIVNGEILLAKRENNDIWKNLYEFPMLEFKNQEKLESYLTKLNIPSSFKKHILSHQRIHAHFVNTDKLPIELNENSYLKIKTSDLDSFPIPRLIEKHLEDIEI